MPTYTVDPLWCLLWWVWLCPELLKNTSMVLVREANFIMRPKYPEPWLKKGAHHLQKRNRSEGELRSFFRCAGTWKPEFKNSFYRLWTAGHRYLWFCACLTRSKERCWGHSVSVYLNVVDSFFCHNNEGAPHAAWRTKWTVCKGAQNLIQQIFTLVKTPACFLIWRCEGEKTFRN